MDRPILADISSKSPTQDILLSYDRVALGRALNNTRVIEDLSVSRVHCVLQRQEDGSWQIWDKSVNGTRVNGTFIAKDVAYKLKLGDIIHLSDTTKFIFKNQFKDRASLQADILQLGKSLQESRNLNTTNRHQSHRNTVKASTNTSQSASVNVNNNAKPPTPPLGGAPSTAPTVAFPIPPPSVSVIEVGTNLSYAEDELQCSICTEIFIKAVTLSCSHTFCDYCITQWRKNQAVCPICRTKIVMKSPTIVLDNFIDKIIENSSSDIKRRRMEIVKERELNMSKPSTSTASTQDDNFLEAFAISDDEDHDSDSDSLDTDSIDDDYEDYLFEEYNGVPGHYYGGYGHCFACGERGHWANGCPTKRRRR